MRKDSYDAATKEAFVAAARTARGENKPWQETFDAARAAGYKGTIGGIKQFLLRKDEPQPVVEAPKKRGRKKKIEHVETLNELLAAGTESVLPVQTDIYVAAIVDGPNTPSFSLESIPEAIRGDFISLVRGKIEKELQHSIHEENLGRAIALYSEIVESRNELNAKIAALKSL